MGKTCKLWAWILAFCMVVSNLSMPVYASVGNGKVFTEDALVEEETTQEETTSESVVVSLEEVSETEAGSEGVTSEEVEEVSSEGGRN